MSGELMVVQYSTPGDVWWAHGSLIFNCRGCPVSSWEFNIQLWGMSSELMVIQYLMMEDVWWAQASFILFNSFPGCSLIPLMKVALLLIQIQLWKNSGNSIHSRKHTPDTTDTAQTQNILSDIMRTSPCYFIHFLLCPLIPIQFQKNSGLPGHSRKQTLEITYTSKPQIFHLTWCG